MLCRFMLIYANLKKDFRRAKVCKYIQKNMLKQIKINVCNLCKFMQIYANELRDLLFKNLSSAETKLYIFPGTSILEQVK